MNKYSNQGIDNSIISKVINFKYKFTLKKFIINFPFFIKTTTEISNIV